MCRGNAAQAVGSCAVATVQRAHSPTSAGAVRGRGGRGGHGERGAGYGAPPQNPTLATPPKFPPLSRSDAAMQALRNPDPCVQEAGLCSPASSTAPVQARPFHAAFERLGRAATGESVASSSQDKVAHKKRQKKPASKAHGRLGSSGGRPMAAQATLPKQLAMLSRMCLQAANTIAASRLGNALIVGCCIWLTVVLGLAAC